MSNPTLINYSHLVLAQAAKSVHDATPIKSAATPQGMCFALQRWLYNFLGLEMPVTNQHIHDMENVVEQHRPKLLAILSSVKLNVSGNLPGVKGEGESDPFTFQDLHYKFVQRDGNLFLMRLEVDKNWSTGSKPVYKECGMYAMDQVTPAKLKSDGLRGYIACQLANDQEPDLTKYSLAIVDDILKFKFSGTRITPKNMREMCHALKANPNKSADAMIDLRGANLVASDDGLVKTVDLSKFVIDKKLALQLIDQGVNYQKVFSQYVNSQLMTGAVGFDISCFDLTRVDCAGMDLRNAAVKSLILRNNPADLLQLQNARLSSSARESVHLALSPSAILAEPELANPHGMVIDGGHTFSARDFVPFAYELGQHHGRDETLGNIALRNFRLHGDQAYFSNDGVQPPNKKTIAKLLAEYDKTKTANVDEIWHEPERPLNPVKRDQYDFFGVVMQAFSGKKELTLLSPSDRYHPDDIEFLFNHLPCEPAKKLEWLKFMLNPEFNTLHSPLHEYLLEPGAAYDNQVAAKTERIAAAKAELIKAKTVQETEAAVTTPKSTEIAATSAKSSTSTSSAKESQIQPRRREPTIFDAARKNGYQFDVSHFTDLARTLQKSLEPEGRSANGGDEASIDEAGGTVLLLNQSLMDSLHIGKNGINLISDCMTPTPVSGENLRTAQKGIQLQFFSAMVKAGVAQWYTRGSVNLGTDEWNYLGHSWGRGTAVEFVNLLPCDRALKIELAKFLYDPIKNSLTLPMGSYLSQPLGMVPSSAQITEADIRSDNAPAVAGNAQSSGRKAGRTAVAPESAAKQQGIPDGTRQRNLRSEVSSPSTKPVSEPPKQVLSRREAAVTDVRPGGWGVKWAVRHVNENLYCDHAMKIQFARYLMNPKLSPLPNEIGSYVYAKPTGFQILVTEAEVMRAGNFASPALQNSFVPKRSDKPGTSSSDQVRADQNAAAIKVQPAIQSGVPTGGTAIAKPADRFSTTSLNDPVYD